MEPGMSATEPKVGRLFRLSYTPVRAFYHGGGWADPANDRANDTRGPVATPEVSCDPKLGGVYTVKGHVRAVRAQGRLTFLELDDGSCADRIHMVLDHERHADLHKRVSSDLRSGATVSARGTLVATPGRSQSFELQVTDMTVIGPVLEPVTYLPGLRGVSMEVWRKHADLRPHARVPQCIFRIRSTLEHDVHEFFHDAGFMSLSPNEITRADCEGAGKMFAVCPFEHYRKLAAAAAGIAIPSHTHTAPAADTKTSTLETKTSTLETINDAKMKLETNGDTKTKTGGAPEALTERKSNDTTGGARFAAWMRDGYFGLDEPARLTVSSQLQLEALCHGMGPVYTLNTSHRAEDSRTSRHVASFTHLEWEIPHITLSDLMDFSEDLFKHCCDAVVKRRSDDVAVLEKWGNAKGLQSKLEGFADPKTRFARITYTEAIDTLRARKAEVLVYAKGELERLPEWGDDIGTCCERFLADVVHQRPVFVFNYPRDLKSFYMLANHNASDPNHNAIDPDDAKSVADRRTVQGCDLLVPLMAEVIGSSIREHRYDVLKAEVQRRKMDPKPIEWYINLRKNGAVPTGGAGLGFDRLVTVCTAMTAANIRDSIPFPVAFGECPF
jgi:asparaginyl-tRNA synthetase